MAFTAEGSLGSANIKTSGATLSMSPTSAVAVGQLVVVFFTWEGADDAGQPLGPYNERWECYDSVGNLYSTIWCRAGPGAPADTDNVATGIFLSKLRTALATTDTITVECQTTTRTPKAMSVEEFSFGPDKMWAVYDLDGAGGGSSGPAQPGAVTFPVSGSLPSQQQLYLYAYGQKGPNSDSFTLDADYTAIAGDGTTGGAATSNVALRGGYRIATLTTDTVDISNDTADRVHCQGLRAICEVDLPPDFPSTPILDDFNRADENPLDGGLWDTSTCVPTFSGHGRIVSNEAAGQSGGPGGSWWLEEIQCEEAEVYADFPTSGSGYGIIVFGDGCGQNGTRNGYEMSHVQDDGSPMVADYLDCGWAESFSGTRTWNRFWSALADDHRFGIQCTGERRSSGGLGIIYYWYDDNTGFDWENISATYERSQELGPDIDPPAKWGFEHFGPSSRMDNFGGGEICDDLPQFYRRVFG